jgi:large subunit ribosomal protein L3
MGQAFVEGFRVPVTKIQINPSEVKSIKTEEKNGYWAVQLSYGRFLREVRVTSEPEDKVGDQVKASDIFSVGDVIAVTGISKGKGFAGGVNRWHFKGGSKTHGQSDRQRAPGSIGTTTTPGRVLKGKKMAGRMGSDTVTVKNLHVISVDPEKFELTVSGQVPGNSGDLVKIRKISSGSLKELEHKVVSQVVEGEGAKTAVSGGVAPVEGK